MPLSPQINGAIARLGSTPAIGPKRAVKHLNQALSLSPNDPQNIVFMIGLGHAHYQAKRYSDAVTYTQNALQQRPEHFGALRQLTASLAQSGRTEEARTMLNRLKQLHPEVSLSWIKENLPLTGDAMSHYLDGFLKAGLE